MSRSGAPSPAGAEPEATTASAFLVGVRVRPPDRVTQHYRPRSGLGSASANQEAARDRGHEAHGFSAPTDEAGNVYRPLIRLDTNKHRPDSNGRSTLTVTHFVKSAGATRGRVSVPTPRSDAGGSSARSTTPGATARRSGSGTSFRRAGSAAAMTSTGNSSFGGGTARSGANGNGVSSAASTALRETESAFDFDLCFVPAPSEEEQEMLALTSGAPRSDYTDASQAAVHRAVGQPTVEHVLRGYNTCIMAYGQTGSGKTFTMLGPDGGTSRSVMDIAQQEYRGLMLRSCEHLFARLAEQQTSPEVARQMMQAAWGELVLAGDPGVAALHPSPRETGSSVAGTGSRQTTPAASSLPTPRVHVKARLSLDTGSVARRSAGTVGSRGGPGSRGASPQPVAPVDRRAVAPQRRSVSKTAVRPGAVAAKAGKTIDDAFGVALHRTESEARHDHSAVSTTSHLRASPLRRSLSADGPRQASAAREPSPRPESPLVDPDAGPGEVDRAFRRAQQHPPPQPKRYTSPVVGAKPQPKRAGTAPKRVSGRAATASSSSAAAAGPYSTPGRMSTFDVSDDSEPRGATSARKTRRSARSSTARPSGATPGKSPAMESVNLSGLTSSDDEGSSSSSGRSEDSSFCDEEEGGEHAPGAVMPPSPAAAAAAAAAVDGFDPAMYEESVTIHVSYYQIYAEKVWCLLQPGPTPLRIREHAAVGPYVEDLASVVVHDYPSMVELLDYGNRNRYTAATVHNRHSSRSHAIFCVRVERKLRLKQTDEAAAVDEDGRPVERPWMHILTSVMNLVDLAGSERVGGVDNLSRRRVKEATDINSSLTTLAKVIHALSERGASMSGTPRAAAHVPYRESALTWLLRDCFGGNARTVMLATVSPELKDVEESLNTLRYSSRARSIVNKPVANKRSAKNQAAIIASLQHEIIQLRGQLAAFRSDHPEGISRGVSTTGGGVSPNSPKRVRHLSTPPSSSRQLRPSFVNNSDSDAEDEEERLRLLLADREKLMMQIASPTPASGGRNRGTPRDRPWRTPRRGGTPKQAPLDGSAAAVPVSTTDDDGAADESGRGSNVRKLEREVALANASNNQLRDQIQALTRLLNDRWEKQRNAADTMQTSGEELWQRLGRDDEDLSDLLFPPSPSRKDAVAAAAAKTEAELRAGGSPLLPVASDEAAAAAGGGPPPATAGIGDESTARMERLHSRTSEASLMRGVVETPYAGPEGASRRRSSNRLSPGVSARGSVRRQSSAPTATAGGGQRGPGGPLHRSLSLLYTDSSGDEVTLSHRRQRGGEASAPSPAKRSGAPAPTAPTAAAASSSRLRAGEPTWALSSASQSPALEGQSFPNSPGVDPRTGTLNPPNYDRAAALERRQREQQRQQQQRKAPAVSKLKLPPPPAETDSTYTDSAVSTGYDSLTDNGPGKGSPRQRAGAAPATVLPPQHQQDASGTSDAEGVDSDDSLIALAPAARPVGATPMEALGADAPEPTVTGLTYSRTNSHQQPMAAPVEAAVVGSAKLAALRPEPISTDTPADGGAGTLGAGSNPLRPPPSPTAGLERADSSARRAGTPRSVAFSDEVRTTTYRPSAAVVGAAPRRAMPSSPHKLAEAAAGKSTTGQPTWPAPSSSERVRPVPELPPSQREFSDATRQKLLEIRRRREELEARNRELDADAARFESPVRTAPRASFAPQQPQSSPMRQQPQPSQARPVLNSRTAPAQSVRPAAPTVTVVESPPRRMAAAPPSSPPRQEQQQSPARTPKPKDEPVSTAKKGGLSPTGFPVAGRPTPMGRTPPATPSPQPRVTPVPSSGGRGVGYAGAQGTPESQRAVDSVERSFQEAMREFQSWRKPSVSTPRQ